MAACACKGIRTCLVCEVTREPSQQEKECSLGLYMCYRCGVVSKPSSAPPSNPLLWTCSPDDCAGSGKIVRPVATDVDCCEEVLCDFGGVLVVKEFVSAQEESIIVTDIDCQKWADSQSGRRKQDYGPKVNFKRQKVKLGSFNGLPSFSKQLLDRMHSTVSQLKSFEPVELCNLEYTPERGSTIDPHSDDSWLWGERLVTLNLLSHTLLTFSTPSQPHSLTASQTLELHLPLPRRSLLIVSGSARHCWHHSIKRENIVSRRVAVTMRELTSEFRSGGRSFDSTGRELLEVARRFDGHPINFL